MIIKSKCRCAGCMKELSSEFEICNCGCKKEEENPPHCLPIGTVLNGKYVVGRVIGEGGFGITYVGLDPDNEDKVAIKEYFMSGFTSRNSTISSEVQASIGNENDIFEINKDKFVKEAKTLATFKNEPGIVTVLGFFMENNTAYIVMEFVEGITLKEFLKQRGVLSVDETIGIIGPVMNSLAKVHEKGLVHRDISPDNIMLTSDGYGKLIDFGAAREANGGNKSLSVVLKHGYAPFEQYQTRGNQGPWTDVYALSATLYRCITGHIPLEATDRMIDDGLKQVCDIAPGCSRTVSNVINKGLSIKVENRYQTVGELKKAFIDALNSPEMDFVSPIDGNGNIEKGSKRTGIDREKLTNDNTSIASVKVGDKILFGEYEQNGDERKHIKWRIIERKDNLLFLISEFGLECKQYHDKHTDITWENCSLRKWLNEDFADEAFTSEELECIPIVDVVSEENTENHCLAGNSTRDRIFLLNMQEVNKYLANNEITKCTVTEHAKRNGASTDNEGKGWWWLRTPGYNNYYAANVYYDGTIHINGYGVRYTNGVVRPAMWLDITNL